MRRLLIMLVLGDALFAAAVGTAAGIAGQEGVQTVFGMLGLIAWAVAFGIDIFWEA